MRPMGSHRSCTRSRLTPVEVRLSTSGGGHTQAVQSAASSRQCSLLRLRVFARSVGQAQCPLGSTGSDLRATIERLRNRRCLVAKSATRFSGFIDRHRRFAHDSPLCRTSAAAVSSPQRCHCTRCPNGTSRAPTDSTPPFPVSAAPVAAEALHPSFSLSFPCPNFSFRGCC